MIQTFGEISKGLVRILAIYLAVVAATFALGCAHKSEKHEQQEKEKALPISQKEAPDAGASIESKQVAAEANAPFVTELHFAKGKANLSKEMASRLQKLYDQAKQVGQISEIHSFAWADQEYPSENAPALPAAEKTLAENRNKAIAAYFSKIGAKVKPDQVTMTERPSGLNKSLNMGDARMKKMFDDAGIQETGAKGTRAPAKKSKAVVMITLKK